MQANKVERCMHEASAFIQQRILLVVENELIQMIALKVVFESLALLKNTAGTEGTQDRSEVTVVLNDPLDDSKLEERALLTSLKVRAHGTDSFSDRTSHWLFYWKNILDYLELLFDPRTGNIKLLALTFFQYGKGVSISQHLGFGERKLVQ